MSARGGKHHHGKTLGPRSEEHRRGKRSRRKEPPPTGEVLSVTGEKENRIESWKILAAEGYQRTGAFPAVRKRRTGGTERKVDPVTVGKFQRIVACQAVRKRRPARGKGA